MKTYELMDRLSDRTRRLLIEKGFCSFEELSAATGKELEEIFRRHPEARKEIIGILPVFPTQPAD